MTVRAAYSPGEPCWVDLGSPDLAASTAFYTSLFGWTAGTSDAEHGGYTVFHLDGEQIAGAGPIGGTGFAPSWGVYLSVADADATATQVTGAGGAVVVPPLDIAGGGRMAVLEDATGALVHVWQPRSFPGARRTHEPGTLTWVELSSRDLEASLRFYGDVFGWTSREVPMGFGPYIVLSLGGRDVAGLTSMAPGMPPEPASFWTPYFEVTDPDVVAGRCADLGGRVLQEPADIDPGRFALLGDPVGATFGIIRGR